MGVTARGIAPDEVLIKLLDAVVDSKGLASNPPGRGALRDPHLPR
jgi:hypothetical protein